MAASFSSFTFGATEYPLGGSYQGWRLAPHYDRTTPLGSTKDDIVLLARGSRELSFENVMTQARFDTAEALIGTVGSFVDFDTSPSTRSALLMNLTIVTWVSVGVLTSARRVQVRWELIEQ